MDIEVGLITKIIEYDGVKEVVNHKITPEFFYGKGKPLFQHILKHYREYRKTPSLEAVQREFPGFQMERSDEPFEYFIDQIRQRHKYNTIVSGLQHLAGILSGPGQDVDEAEVELYKLTSKVSTELRLGRDLNYANDAEDRIERYVVKKTFCGVDGIPIHIEPIDNITGGAHGGELITILGQPGSGKTFFELVVARAALREGYRVLFITKEMEPEQIAVRMDAVLLGYTFDKVRRGLLGDTAERKYFEDIRALKDTCSDFIISADEGEGGVTSIQAKVEEFNPDLVIVDGSYLIIDEDGGKSQWERAMNITRRLKRLARKVRLPIYNSTQAGRQVKRSTAPDMEDVAFTYSYAQDSDAIISIYRSEEMVAGSKLGVKLAKVRDGANMGHFILNWDFEDMQSFGSLASDLTMSDIEDDDSVIF